MRSEEEIRVDALRAEIAAILASLGEDSNVGLLRIWPGGLMSIPASKLGDTLRLCQRTVLAKQSEKDE
jgi:hypothetical protein